MKAFTLVCLFFVLAIAHPIVGHREEQIDEGFGVAGPIEDNGKGPLDHPRDIQGDLSANDDDKGNNDLSDDIAQRRYKRTIRRIIQNIRSGNGPIGPIRRLISRLRSRRNTTTSTSSTTSTTTSTTTEPTTSTTTSTTTNTPVPT